MKSTRLNIVLPLIALITRPNSLILTGSSLLVLSIMKFLFEGQSIFFEHWRDIYGGLLNPEVPFEQKLFIISFFMLITGLALFYTNIFKAIVISQSKRFGTKPKV